MRRQIRTAYTNLNDRYDSWKKFLVTYGFVAKIINESGTKEIIFTDDQKCHITNVDETNPKEVSIPYIDESEVGCAKSWQFQMMLQSLLGYDNQELQQLANELLRLFVERGVELNAV